MENDTEFTGKTIALSGSGPSSLARALADAFARRGAAVMHVGEPAADGLSSGGPVQDATGIDALILLSRPPVETPFLQLSDTDWTGAIQTTLLSSARLIRALGEGMVTRQQGCIVVIGSLSGTTGWPGYAVSSMVDGALIALVRSLACEWAAHNVRLVYLAYGAVQDTGNDATTEMAAKFAARTPLGQSATPEQIAQVAVYLASSRASFVTGSVVRADGGWTAWGLLR